MAQLFKCFSFSLLFFSVAAAADLPKPVAQAGKRLRALARRAHQRGEPGRAAAIAGYVLDRNGKRHTVVMIVNHPRAPEADAAIDALLAWVYASRLQSQLAP